MVIKPRQENGRLLWSAPLLLRPSSATDKELFGHLLRVVLRLEFGGRGLCLSGMEVNRGQQWLRNAFLKEKGEKTSPPPHFCSFLFLLHDSQSRGSSERKLDRERTCAPAYCGRGGRKRFRGGLWRFLLHCVANRMARRWSNPDAFGSHQWWMLVKLSFDVHHERADCLLTYPHVNKPFCFVGKFYYI